jgi:hypothetical protein
VRDYALKPLVRWTLGKVIPEGVDCLLQSIKKWRLFYGEQFDYCVCFNHTKPRVPDYVDCTDQRNYKNSLPLPPRGPAWKLYPPRLRESAHEIIIDNDLVLDKPHPLINDFLSGGLPLLTEGFEKSYGSFDKDIPDHIVVNTGIIGLPPNYDFRYQLLKAIDLQQLVAWETHFCEQGAVASVLTPCLIIPKSDISIGVSTGEYESGKYGNHFVGLNYGDTKWWYSYLSQPLL